MTIESSQSQTIPRAWLVLFTSLCLSAGHGIALYFVVSRVKLIPSIRDMGDGEAAVLVGWFLAAVPLAGLALLFRGRLERSSQGKLRVLAALALVLTVVAFARYALIVARG